MLLAARGMLVALILGLMGWWTVAPANASTRTKITEVELPSWPEEIARGPGGTMWYTALNYKVGKVNPDRTVEEFTTSASPYGIALGPDGNMWFTEMDWSGFGSIGRVTPQGQVTEFQVPSWLSYPLGIAAGPDGNMWFTENDAAKIGRITMDGAISEMSWPGLVRSPAGIAAGPDGSMWFVDGDLSTVGRVTMDGDLALYHTPTPFSGPIDIAAGPDGNMWFTERDAVGRITPGGTITEFPVDANWYVNDIAGLPHSVVFTEPGSSEIGQVRAPDGIVEYRLLSRIQPWALAQGPHQTLWITDNAGPRIIILSAS